MSKTLSSLADLDHEFRNHARLMLKQEQREQLNTQMDRIVEMFHAHDNDKTIDCYNKAAHIDNAEIESKGTPC